MNQMILHREFLEFLAYHLSKNSERMIVLMMFHFHEVVDGSEYPSEFNSYALRWKNATNL